MSWNSYSAWNSYQSTGLKTNPTGLFTSAPNLTAQANTQCKGVQLRAFWSDLNPSNGVYNWAALDDQITAYNIDVDSLDFVIGVHSGQYAPQWVKDQDGGPVTVSQTNANTYTIPEYWSPGYLVALTNFANALAAKYGSNPRLRLVHISQPTWNGIESGWTGSDVNNLVTAGITGANWRQVAIDSCTIFANAFTTTPLALEMHDALNLANTAIDHTNALNIMNDITADANLAGHVGVSMWWLSGYGAGDIGNEYQTDLIADITAFSGPKYGELINMTGTYKTDGITPKIKDNTLNSAFLQAADIGLQYLQVWYQDFFNNVEPAAMAYFNANYTGQQYASLLSGDFTLSGSAINSINNHLTPLQQGVFTLTGSDISTLHDHINVLDSGAFILSGSVINTSYSAGPVTVTLQPGSFTISGQAINSLRHLVGSLQPAAFTLAGGDLSGTVGQITTLQPGSFMLVGADINELYQRIDVLESGGFVINGAVLSTLYSATPELLLPVSAIIRIPRQLYIKINQ